jgi:hypothetical protein
MDIAIIATVWPMPLDIRSRSRVRARGLPADDPAVVGVEEADQANLLLACPLHHRFDRSVCHAPMGSTFNPATYSVLLLASGALLSQLLPSSLVAGSSLLSPVAGAPLWLAGEG